MSKAAGQSLGNRIAPARFVTFLLLFPAGAFAFHALQPAARWDEALALGFDLAALVFLLSLIPLLRDTSAKKMREHARDNDANRGLVLVLTSLVGFAVMAAISGELSAAKSGEPLALAKLIGTLALIWLFANSSFALHYAHAFYLPDPGTGKDGEGISFPGTKVPDYGDFAYFAFTLGMTFQTSDVEVTRPGVRRVVLFHCLAAFVFNIGVIAFTINALG